MTASLSSTIACVRPSRIVRDVTLAASVFLFTTAADFAVGSADELVKQGDALDARHLNAEALAIFRQADSIDPDNPEILRRIAKQLSQQIADTPARREKLRLARESLEFARRAVELNPKNAEARLSLAICAGRLGLLESPTKRVELSKKVRSEAEAATRLDPGNDYAWHVLGRWHFEMATLNPAVRLIAETIYGRFPDASMQKAAEYLERAVSSGPPRVVHHVELGRAYLALGRTDEARQQLEKGLALPSKEKEDAATKLRAREALKSMGSASREARVLPPA